jgi:phenylalanyl-tRNA synthetase beta chain
VGILGELAPKAIAAFDLRGRVVVAEVRLDAIAPDVSRRLRFRSPPRYPAIVHDLAVTVDADQAAGAAIRIIRRAGGVLLESVALRDEYRSERLGPGRKGWMFELTFRAADRTLTTDEARLVQDAILLALKSECGAELRQ